MLEQNDYDALCLRPADMPFTGKGSVIAIVDQPLWLGHTGYNKAIEAYTRIGDQGNYDWSTHGSSVVSIAVDRNIGVAPDALVYYCSLKNDPRFISCRDLFNDVPLHLGSVLGYLSEVQKCGKDLSLQVRKFCSHSFIALLDHIKSKIESGEHIDAVSMSIGFPRRTRLKEIKKEHDKNLQLPSAYWDIMNGFVDVYAERIQWFGDNNIPLFCPQNVPSAFFFGMNGPATWMNKSAWSLAQDKLVGVPVEDRLVARFREGEMFQRHPETQDAVPCEVAEINGGDYYRCLGSGISWGIPFVAGMFALAREADRNITVDQFLPYVRSTAQQVDFKNGIVLPVVDVKAFADKLVAERKKVSLTAKLNP